MTMSYEKEMPMISNEMAGGDCEPHLLVRYTDHSDKWMES